MRVLIIYPPITGEERYSSSLGHAGGHQIPLGIFYLAAYLRREGHDVGVIDGEARQMTAGDVVSDLGHFRPDVVGISSTTVAMHRAVDVAERTKAAYPDLPIALGGPHVSSCPEHALSLPVFDFGVLGEGEVTFAEAVRVLAEGRSYESVHGLAFMRAGTLVRTPPRTLIGNLDDLPHPAFDLIPDISVYNPPPCNYKELPVINLITTRGCPNQCTFCDRSVFGRLLREHSAAGLADEIEMAVRELGAREIAFVDDTFTLRPERIRESFSILDERDIRLPWTCMSRINTVDFDLLRFMKEHGCWHISFGIESGNDEILKLIKKNVSLSQARDVIGWCRDLGIRSKGFFIVGHPGETEETIEQTIRLALELPLDDIVVPINTPTPGTQQYLDAGEYGTLVTGDWRLFNCWNPVFVPRGLTKETLLAKHREFYRRFYLRPRILWRYLLSFISPAGPRRLVSLLKSLPFLFRRQPVPGGKAPSGNRGLPKSEGRSAPST